MSTNTSDPNETEGSAAESIVRAERTGEIELHDLTVEITEHELEILDEVEDVDEWVRQAIRLRFVTGNESEALPITANEIDEKLREE